MKYITFLWLLLIATTTWGQDLDPRIARVETPLSKVERLEMPALDNEALLEAERKRRQPGVAPRFAEVIPVDVKPSTHGVWDNAKGDQAVWRLRISSPGAHSLNLGFTLFQMPEGGRLILYSPDYQRVRGPFTPADNEEHAQLWTPILEGDELVIEVQLPKDKIPELGLHLSTVNHDFMGFAQAATSGSCNLDVVCGAADGYPFVEAYRDVIRSVGVYGLRGSLFCTGFLVNNTREDCTPFFMTAAHCEVTAEEAASLVVYWNFENSTCREPGSPASGSRGDGRLDDFNSGAILRASYNPSDMALLELDDPVSSTADAYFAGWTREMAPPANGVASVHHPSADEKSISYATRPTYLGAWATGPDNVPNGNHIVVPEWAVGTTETGSSGGPLFNDQALVVGQLHGGIANCTNGGYDTFGAFATSWEGGGTRTTSLRRWLDPDNTGISSLAGRSQRTCSFFVEARLDAQAVCAPDTATFVLDISDVFSAPVDLTVSGLPEGLEATFSQRSVTPGGSTELYITGAGNLASGSYTFTVTGTDGMESADTELELNIFQSTPNGVNLLEPADGATDLNIRANFSWADEPFASRYEFELALDPGFQQIVASVSDLASSSLENFALSAMTTYYWRVRGQNLCGLGPWSSARSFTTAGIGCAAAASVDIPKNISRQINTVTSSIEITAPGRVQEMQLTGLDITHTFVGDLRVSLISPQGTEIVLFDRPGLPQTFFGCDGDDLLLDFSDEALLTASDLENTCNTTTLPAIEGLFQPQQAFANLKGEPITGTWTLQVADLVPEDGGRLNGWGLAFCTSLPQSEALFTATERYQACVGAPVNLQLLVGTGFSDTIPITESGLPPEAAVTYSSNPADPGTTVDVSITGIAAGGEYDVTFSADTTQVHIQLSMTDQPAPVIPLQPLDSSLVHSDRVALSWQSSPGADYYDLIVFEDVIAGAPFLSVPLVDTFFVLEDLDLDADYFWQVIPQGACAGDVPDTFQTFFTLPDLALGIDPMRLEVCQMETASFTISVGPGFTYPARISYRLAPADTLAIRYDVEPDSIAPGSSVRVTLEDLRQMAPGGYTLTFLVQDSLYADSTALLLNVESGPGLARLLTPANNATLMTPTPSFEWEAATAAETYRLEIASDAAFTDVLSRQEIEGLTFDLTNELTPGDYYWRVIALNRCGGATSAAFRFSVQSTATTEWAGASLKWYPNPTDGFVRLDFGLTLAQPAFYTIHDATGRTLRGGEIPSGTDRQDLDLHALPAGVYLVRLRQERATVTFRVIRR